MGSTRDLPPPVAPPLTPKTGPREGSLRAATTFLPMRASAWVRPTDTVVLPSPAGVGVMAETRMSEEFFFRSKRLMASSLTLAL